MTHPHVDIVRDGYAAFSRGDLETLKNRFFAPDIVWHYGGRSSFSGDFKGSDDVLGWLGRMFELSGGTLSVELHDVVGNADHVVALTTIRATKAGQQLSDHTIQVFHMRDGKVTEVWTCPEDQYRSDEFWA